jgi:hypothetical protein
LGGELGREVASADRIDVLVAFITVGGVRLLRDALESFARRSSTQTRLRILTTVFTLQVRCLAAPVAQGRIDEL